MLIYTALFIAGVLLLVKGGNYFVNSSLLFARRTGFSRMFIGGTIMSVATTSPELVVSATASLQGNPELAVGNAVGSVIANIGLVVGVTALISPVRVKKEEFYLPVRIMLISGVLLALIIADGSVPRWAGLLLLMAGLGYLVMDTFLNTRRRNNNASTSGLGHEDEYPLFRNIIFFLLGAGLVILGSRLLVYSSLNLALLLGLPPLFVGLSMVALGTSLPELVTAIMSLKRGVADLSLGNILGANILNITMVTGLAASILPFELRGREDIYSLLAMLVFLLLLFFLGRSGGRLSRQEGVILLVFYSVYIIMVFRGGILF